ncbi:MAG: MBL fold metallo-hydrolase [Clostridiales bacterium]|nr:MBL fold metallo-hydrolase [Candidatus Cacconaster stercorequi]
MKLTILTDNTTRIDRYYLGEPGASYYLEDGDARILFDTGYSDVYRRNAEKLGIDLAAVTAVALSHGHNDHTGGLRYFPETEEKLPLVAHPAAFEPKRYGETAIGSPLEAEELAQRFALRLTAEPVQLSEHIMWLGQVPRTVPFENRSPIGEHFADGAWQPDFLMDDTALVYRGAEGLWIITGCSHVGICNITEYAKRVTGEERICGIIGGFHLLKMTSRVGKTVEYLKAQHPAHLCPCHCTCFHARAAIHAAVPVEEVCVGDTMEL